MHPVFRVVTAALWIGALAPAVVSANEPRVHDRGFFLRLSGGIGAASTSTDIGPIASRQELKLSGPAGEGDFAIGALVGRNFAIHASVFGWNIVDPEVEVNDISSEADDVTVGLSAFGPGITGYFGPNMYLSAAVGAATLSAEEDRVTVESKTGVAFQAVLGKEWWVGRRWGLGIAGAFGFHSVPQDDEDSDEKLSGSSLALRFSATFN